ncbi:MAG: efflux RND transporter periplasmic adaptor subunit, partial [Erysipelotrichales bacterium]|nr:efflux RND transporter periplasmic adaptor subunit [Erysipelotrichales bacterium]
GDKLFTYKIADMELDLQQLNVDLQSYYNQIDDLNEQKRYSSSQYEIQIINMQISNTQTEIQKKRNEIEAKKREMEQAYVTSPIDGVIKEINDPNSMMYTGSGAYMTIIADGEFLIKCKISEMNVSEIYQGMEMVIRSRVNENQTWKGTISSIDTGSPVNEENQGFYGGGQESGAKYAFYVKPETPDGLLLGQHVTVESSVSSSAGYTGILLNSGFIADIESKAFVWVSKNGTLKKSYVTIGKYKADSDEYEITSGLEKDDYIAFPDETLKEGMKTTTEYIPEEEPGLDDGDFYVIPEGDVPEDDGMMIPEDGGMFVPGEEPAGGESNGQ